jgi:hypothetical protein
MARRTKKECWLLGIGFDGTDGHKRLTKGKRFLIAGGSEETHEHMTEKVIRLDGKLRRKGKTFADLEPKEFIEAYLEEE